jgi:hypothetical protein
MKCQEIGFLFPSTFERDGAAAGSATADFPDQPKAKPPGAGPDG